MATWNSIIYILIHIPIDTDDFNKEFNLIIKIDIFKGYKKLMILTLVKKNISEQKNKNKIKEVSSLKS